MQNSISLPEDGALAKQYAKLAKFLSTPADFSTQASELSAALQEYYIPLKAEGLRGAFSYLFGVVASCYGFSKSNVFLNGRVSHPDFASIVRNRVLFRDRYYRPHGEYSHAIQWLVSAMELGDHVATLYQHSVDYQSKDRFKVDDNKETQPFLWNFLVDYFEAKKKGAEDYATNLFADSFRCPQYTTVNLDQTLPTKSWLGSFIQKVLGSDLNFQQFLDLFYSALQ